MHKQTDGLVEVRCGQTGRGLLVENDGHILADSDIVKQINEDLEHGDKFFIPDRFIVPAVFQKYGIENANKRIYPKDILVPQVDRYIAERVKTRCAIGALDHPNCWKPGVRVLMSDGDWKAIEEVSVGDVVQTLAPQGVIEPQPVQRIVAAPYKGDMVRICGGNLDMCVTPNHTFPVFGQHSGFLGLFTAMQIAERQIPERMGACIPTSMDGSMPNALALESGTTCSVEPYDGMVHCLEVANHTFYVMCENGQCVWSGNSTSLSGHDVSHNIINLEWDKQTLVGEMELHLSPGFRKYGVCSTSGDLVANMLLDNYLIGVSSRGEGNVESKLGKMLVTEFFLLCWDVVLEPSTPNAYIGRDRSQLRPYIEQADRPASNHAPLSEKINAIDKIKHILNG